MRSERPATGNVGMADSVAAAVTGSGFVTLAAPLEVRSNTPSGVADAGPTRWRRCYSTIDCITAFSKSRSVSLLGLDVWIMRIPTIFSLGSTQKCVPKAPSQPKLPSDTR